MQSGSSVKQFHTGCAFDIAVILLEVDGENSAMTAKIMGLTSLPEETYFHLKLPHHRNAFVETEPSRSLSVRSEQHREQQCTVPLRFAV